jgi:hypothetical protein
MPHVMNANPKMFEEEAGFEELAPHLELLLVYEDVPTALRARHAVDNVLNRPESRAHYHIHAWNLDLLPQPEFFYGQAINDALAADIVVLSTHGTNEPGLEAMSRLMQWVGLKRDTPCALIISADPTIQPLTIETPAFADLCRAAESNGMTVIFHAGEPQQETDPDPALGEAMPTVIAAIKQQSSLSPARWGINE